MITFLEEDKILFSCDIFSTHLANTEYFNDAAKDNIKEDYTLYYQLIMHPHRRHVKEMLGKISKLKIQMIAPSHGFILRKNVQEYIDLYEEMSRETEVGKKATIIYSSMTGNTRKLSKQLKANLELDGILVDLLDLNTTDENIIIRSVQESDLLLIGTSTKYADMTGKTEEIVKKIVELDLQGKAGGAFGSYGWSGEGIEVLQDYLLKSNMNILTTSEIIKTTGVNDVHFPLRIRFLPEDETARIIERTTNYISGILLNAY
jgi:flavorubredoxin